MSEFAGKRVLVTGGVSGIGRAIAMAFARQQAEVVVTALTQQHAEDCAPFDPTVAVSLLDITSDDSIARLISELDRLDCLINCAGTILRDGREHEPAGFQQVIDVNLNGTMRMCAACKPLLEQSGGCVINIASMLTFFGSGHVPAYSASKGGIGQLTKSLAIAWAESNIRVNAIAPGWIKTALTDPLVEDAERSRRIVERTPLGRWGQPEDIAGAALFLCGSGAGFITGVILPVDGGFSIC